MKLNVWQTPVAAMCRARAEDVLDRLEARLAAARRSGSYRHTRPDARPHTWLRRAAVTLLGVGIILIGVPMLVLPGPGVLAILLGLSILAAEFAWARQLLEKVAVWARQALGRAPRMESQPRQP